MPLAARLWEGDLSLGKPHCAGVVVGDGGKQ